MRKLIAIFIAIVFLQVSAPLPSFAKEKDSKHKTHRQKRAEKKQKKRWAKIRSRSNDYRFKREKYVGANMLKKQTPKEQKKRRKYHLKPEGGTY